MKNKANRFALALRVLRFARLSSTWKIVLERISALHYELRSRLIRFSLTLWRMPEAATQSLGRKLWSSPLRLLVERLPWIALSNQPPGKTRLYIPPEKSRIRFLEDLGEQSIEYVLLRWGDRIRELPRHEDLDILCAEQDLGGARKLLSKKVSSMPVDLFSSEQTSSLSLGGSSFPPGLTSNLLSRRVLTDEKIWTPDPESYLQSLAYHLLFHKRSTFEETQGSESKHTPLGKLILELSEAVLGVEKSQVNSQLLLGLLDSAGFLPSLETIRGISSPSTKLSIEFRQYLTSARPEANPHLAVFVLRDSFTDELAVDLVTKTLREEGFHLLDVIYLEEWEIHKVAQVSRGGDWGSGPFPRSGGLPGALVICFDSFPEIEPSIHPVLDTHNKRYQVKNSIRTKVNSQLSPAGEESNGIHSPDTAEEAMEMLESLWGKRVANKYLEQAESHSQKMIPAGFSLLEKMPRTKSRSLSMKGMLDNELVFVKSFAVGFERMAAREVAFYEKFSGVSPLVPELRATGSNWICLPWFEFKELTRPEFRNMIRENSRSLVEFLRMVSEAGFFIGDFGPQNLHQEKNGDLKILDFEFAHRIDSGHKLEYSPSFSTRSELEQLDMPDGWLPGLENWDFLWWNTPLSSSIIMSIDRLSN